MAANAYEEAKERLAAIERGAAEHWDALVANCAAALTADLHRDVKYLLMEVRIIRALLESKAPQKQDELLNVNEAAALLNIHRTTVGKLARDGKLPHQRIGKKYRFSRVELTKAS